MINGIKSMYYRWTFFKLKMKKLTGMLPLIFLETLLFSLLIFGAGVFATKAVYGEKAVGEIKIGITAEGEDLLTEMLVKFVQSMDSVKDTVSFELLSEEEARDKAASGEILAAILIPEGMVDSIISGENLPATVLLDKSYSSVETEVFEQLTEAAAKLLTVAQSGIYAADAFCLENGRGEQIKQTEDALNEAYLKYAMGRTSVFHIKEVSAVKGITLTDYYGISLFLAFLSFVGISWGKYLQVKQGERERLLCARGFSMEAQYMTETGAFATVFALFGMLISLPFYFFFVRWTNSTFQISAAWTLLAVVWLVMGAFLGMLLQITGNGVGGIGVCFVILLSAMFVSGVFIPTAFLPLWLEKIGGFLPYKGWMEAMQMILQGNPGGRVVLQLLLKLLLQAVVFLAAGGFAAWWKGRNCSEI